MDQYWMANEILGEQQQDTEEEAVRFRLPIPETVDDRLHIKERRQKNGK